MKPKQIDTVSEIGDDVSLLCINWVLVPLMLVLLFLLATAIYKIESKDLFENDSVDMMIQWCICALRSNH